MAAELARRLHMAAQQAASEEDLRIAAESALGDALRRLGVPSAPSYERSYANHAGRSDAVYGRVVVEYEAVGALSTSRGVAHAAEQLERYLRAEAGSTREGLKRVVGVGIDGHRIFFLRFTRSTNLEPELFVAPGQGILPLEIAEDWGGDVTPVLDGPHEITPESVQTFLLYLRAANRSRLTPEGLAQQFGPTGPCAARTVGAIVRALRENAENARVDTLFREWDRVFGIVYGVDLDAANRHASVLRNAYGVPVGNSLKVTLFAVHTYYALLMKLLAAELIAMQRESLIDSFLAPLPSATDEALHSALRRIETGEVFAHFAVQNFLEADFFGWYLEVWNDEVSESIREMIRLLATFEPASGVLDPGPTQDLLKRLYQMLVPKQIRHDLGEYYTPNWLAELALDEAKIEMGAGRRILDPACGSGTFLVAAINRARAHGRDSGIEPAETAKAILRDIVGYDLNPLAVIAARTNYLLALGPLLRELPLVEIPVYMCDSILAPTATDVGLLGHEYELRTSAGTFTIPSDIVDAGQVPLLTGLLDRCLRDDYTPGEFMQVVEAELGEVPELSRSVLSNLYRALITLKREGRDGIWARIIRNAFAPLTSGLFDHIVGNPPWVNWQSLAPEYRSATQAFWTGYGLFSLSGHAARLGGGKKDLSAVMLYRCMDAYLRNGGRLTFIITRSLFKSKGAGDGFRRFQIGDGAHLAVQLVHDMTDLQPFEGATTQTSLVVIDKGKKTAYPVRYVKWKRSRRIPNITTATLANVRSACVEELLGAAPIDASKRTSPWLTAPLEVDATLRDILGPSYYRAFAGVCTWANGIYWLEVRESAPNGFLRVRNMANEAKEKDVETVDALVEADYVFPLVRSRDIRRWHAQPSTYMLVPQDPRTKSGIPETTLRVQAPGTYRYLKRFEAKLAARSGMVKYFDAARGDAFYSVYNVSEGTFARYKVMWRQMVPRITAAVVGRTVDPFLGETTVVTQHVATIIATDDLDEAHFVCAMLNSSIATSISASYSTGKSFGTPSMLEYVPIPRFDRRVETHARLAGLSREAHERAGSGGETADLDSLVDIAAAEVWGVDPASLPAMQSLVRALGPRGEGPGEPVADD